MSLTPAMDAFRRLMTVVLIAGSTAGLMLAAVQHVTMGPLIARAEQYEHASAQHGGSHGAGMTAATHGEEWEPADGFERTGYTVLGTVLTGIGFAAVLFGVASLLGLELNAARGLGLGLLAFICCVVAPAVGLPPRPPGAPAAELYAAQWWWSATVLATTIGVWTMARARGSWPRRVIGVLMVLLPHAIGAPAAMDESAVPKDLADTFAMASVATQAVFWLVLGAIGGWLFARRTGEPSRVSHAP